MDETHDLSPSNAMDFKDFSYLPWDSDSVFIMELIKGKRCIATFDEDTDSWRFFTWHMVELHPNINMGNIDKRFAYDGFISTQRDFNTSMALSQYVTDVGAVRPSYNVSEYIIRDVFVVVDIFNDAELFDVPYTERRTILDTMVNSQLDFKGAEGIYLIPLIERVTITGDVYENSMYTVINIFNKVKAEGADGIVLYFDKATYCHGKTYGVQILRAVKTASMLIEKVFFKDDEEGRLIDSFLCHGVIDGAEVMTKVKAYTMRKKSRREYAQTDQMLQGKICEVIYNNLEAPVNGMNTYSMRSPRALGVRGGEEGNKIFIY